MSNGKRPKSARRILIVDPGFQWRSAFVIAGMVLVISSVLSAVLYGTLHQQSQLQSETAGTQSMGLTFIFFLCGIAFSVLTIAGVAFWCLIVTHRMCGPLFVMSRALREVADGRLPDLRPLRKKDNFKEFYEVFTEAIDALRVRREAELATLTEAADLLEQTDLWDEPLRERAEQLVTRIEALRTGDSNAFRRAPVPTAV